jgi:hypothetical protein
MVRVIDPKVVRHLDAYSAPRLVEYFDPDPCEPMPTARLSGTDLIVQLPMLAHRQPPERQPRWALLSKPSTRLASTTSSFFPPKSLKGCRPGSNRITTISPPELHRRWLLTSVAT